MKPHIWTDPLRDVQCLPPAAWCRRCRGELYAATPDGLCPQCSQETEGEDRCLSRGVERGRMRNAGHTL